MNSIIQLIIFLYLQLMMNMFEKCSHTFDNMSNHFDQELNYSFIVNHRIRLDIYCSTHYPDSITERQDHWFFMEGLILR